MSADTSIRATSGGPGAGPLATEPPVVIVGGFLSWPGQYRAMAQAIRELSGLPVFVVPLTPADWLGVLAFGKPGQLVFEIATTVDKALLESRSKQAIIVGHSAGGVASRVYIGGDPPFGGRRYSGHRRVSHLITLGSPHLVSEGWPLSLIHRANEQFPGALHEGIDYRAVAGAAVHGADSKNAARIYNYLTGESKVSGDGVFPVESALLPGARRLVFEDLAHDHHRGRWYGSDLATIARWWPVELRREGSLKATKTGAEKDSGNER